jgi:DNA primase small subunit
LVRRRNVLTEGRGPAADFLARAYKAYYFRHVESVEVPEEIGDREFGYLNFDDAMVRHLTFPNEGELKAMMVRESPRSAYCSVAYYDAPELPMEEKGYRKADLAFDIDSGDLNLPCTTEHDFSLCGNCGRPFRTGGESCPLCGSVNVSSVHLACEKCLTGAKEEAIKLVNVLQLDFGVAPGEIRAYFSGNRGYHLSVVGSKYENLDQRGRSEMVEYMAGRGLTARQLGLMPRRSVVELVSKVPSPEEPGWRGRVAAALEETEGTGTREALAKAFTEQPERMEGLVKEAVDRISVKLDAGVTIDTHRVFRMGQTLHDKSGLLKKRYWDLDSADPLVDAVAFGSEPVRVQVTHSPRFWLLGSSLGPYEKASVELPTYGAVYLMAKGLAEPS